SPQCPPVGSAQPWIAGARLRSFMRRQPRLYGAGAGADQPIAPGKESRMSSEERTEVQGAQRRRLGRGLGALLGEARREEPLVTSAQAEADGDAPVTAHKGDGLASLPIAAIEPHPEQPRRRFDAEALDELSASIAERGVIQPIIV